MPNFIKLVPVVLSLSLWQNVAAQQWQLVWSDEFNLIELDTSKWSYESGNGCPTLCGWGNNEWEFYTDRTQNVRLENGLLIIEAHQESYMGSNYTSGKIRSKGKADFQFGRIEARMRLPEGQGIWPAFWMLPSSSGSIWPTDGEIDIMELVGHQPAVSHGTIHFGPSWPNNRWSGSSYHLQAGKFSDDFHLFGIEWRQDEIKWFVDSTIFQVKTPLDVHPHNWPFNNPFHFILNLAVGGNWPGYPDQTTVFPQRLEIDWVRVYKDTVISYEPQLIGKKIHTKKPTRSLISPNFEHPNLRKLD